MKDKKNLLSAGRFIYMGLNVSLPLICGVYFGASMDRRFSTGSVFLFLGTFLGIVLGIAGIFRIIALEEKNGNRRDS